MSKFKFEIEYKSLEELRALKDYLGVQSQNDFKNKLDEAYEGFPVKDTDALASFIDINFYGLYIKLIKAIEKKESK